MSMLTVELGDRSYPIHIEAGLLSKPAVLSPYIKGPLAVIITNDVVAPLYLEKAKAACGDVHIETIIIPDGEQHKSLEQFGVIMTRLLEMNAASGWIFEAGDQPQQCCLSASRRSKKTDEFTRMQLKIDAPENPVLLGRSEAMPEIADLHRTR